MYRFTSLVHRGFSDVAGHFFKTGIVTKKLRKQYFNLKSQTALNRSIGWWQILTEICPEHHSKPGDGGQGLLAEVSQLFAFHNTQILLHIKMSSSKARTSHWLCLGNCSTLNEHDGKDIMRMSDLFSDGRFRFIWYTGRPLVSIPTEGWFLLLLNKHLFGCWYGFLSYINRLKWSHTVSDYFFIY